MKKLLVAITSIFLCEYGHAAISRVQKAISDSCSTTISANTAGNLLVVFCEGQTTYPTAVSDNAAGGSNTYTEVTGARGALSGPVGATTVWYSRTTNSGATTVTCTSASDCYGSGVREYSGALASGDPVDTSSGSVSTGCTGTSCLGAPVTTTDAGAVIIGYAIPGNSITAVDSPFTDFLGGTANGHAFADYLPGTTVTANQATWTDSSSGDSVGSSVVAFKAEGGGGGGPSGPGSINTTPGFGSINSLPGTGSINSVR